VTPAHQLARVVGSGGTDAPAYRVELRVGRHHLVGDEPPNEGGADVGPSPFGFLLSGLAACTATTLRMYAARKGWDLTSITVDVRYDIDESEQASIQRTITVPSLLTAEQRQRLADIATRTPVTLAIRTPISTVVQPGPEPA
jgi:putative redox protein